MKAIFKYMAKNKLGALTLMLSLTYMFVGLPSQIHRIWETQSAKDISLPMFTLLTIQSFFWVMYGVQRRDWIMVTANAFGTLFSVTIVSMCFIFK